MKGGARYRKKGRRGALSGATRGCTSGCFLYEEDEQDGGTCFTGRVWEEHKKWEEGRKEGGRGEKSTLVVSGCMCVLLFCLF